MRLTSVGWPTLDHRLRLEPTSTFSVLCHAEDATGLLKATTTKEAKGNDHDHKSNGDSDHRDATTIKTLQKKKGLSVTEDASAKHGERKERIAVKAMVEADEEAAELARAGLSSSSSSSSPTHTTRGTADSSSPLSAGADSRDAQAGVVCIEVVCPYTRSLVTKGFARRRQAWRVTAKKSEATLHWADYELIDWTRVVAGDLRASSYCVRKGLSRKAQLSRYCNKYISKRPETPLRAALPRTLVIDTWEAFDEDMTFNLGGDIASFGADFGVRQSVSLETRLDWCLAEAKEWVEEEKEGGQGGRDETFLPGRHRGRGGRRRNGRWRWILKPSTLNKGAGLALGEGFDLLREAVHSSPDIREWVLQEYVDRPLLTDGRKFHLRAYALAVECLRVYLFEQVLLLRAAKKYPLQAEEETAGGGGLREGGADSDDDEVLTSPQSGFGLDPLAHITNTARQAEDESFREEDNVWLLDDLVAELERQGLSREEACHKVEGVKADMRTLTAELFRAFRGEFTVFSPLPGCFEHFGLDFMVDQDFRVWLLEANPGPDFKQTGARLRHVIGDLIEGTMRICLDENLNHCYGNEDRNDGSFGGDGKEDRRSGTIADDVTDGSVSGRITLRARGYSLVLDEQWRGSTAAPSMKMV